MLMPDIDVSFADNIKCNRQEIRSIISQSVSTAIKVAQVQFNKDAELSILIADDTILQKLNCKWRGKDKPTNVLSFTTQIIEKGKIDFPMLGDIAISLDTAKKESTLENKHFNHHLSHLVIHGFLHLFGYDHETEEEAIQMESLETRILERLGITDPYQV